MIAPAFSFVVDVLYCVVLFLFVLEHEDEVSRRS